MVLAGSYGQQSSAIKNLRQVFRHYRGDIFLLTLRIRQNQGLFRAQAVQRYGPRYGQQNRNQ